MKPREQRRLQRLLKNLRWDLIRQPQPAPPTILEYLSLDKTILLMEVHPRLWKKIPFTKLK